MKAIQTLFNPNRQKEFTTRQSLTLIGLAGLVTLLLTTVPGLTLLNYPFRLLLTMIHELGHGLAAILTGGQFIRFVINLDGSGLAHTAGGWRWLVIPAGYLGAVLFGAGLIMLGRSHRWSRTALALLGGAMIFLSLRYGGPSIFSVQLVSGLLTTVSGLLLGGLFLWVAFKATPGWIIFLLHLVAIQAGLMAFTDLTKLTGPSSRFFNQLNNDARSMAELTSIPAIVWAWLWVLAAVILLGGAIWLTWLAPFRRRRERSSDSWSARPTFF